MPAFFKMADGTAVDISKVLFKNATGAFTKIAKVFWKDYSGAVQEVFSGGEIVYYGSLTGFGTGGSDYLRACSTDTYAFAAVCRSYSSTGYIAAAVDGNLVKTLLQRNQGDAWNQAAASNSSLAVFAGGNKNTSTSYNKTNAAYSYNNSFVQTKLTELAQVANEANRMGSATFNDCALFVGGAGGNSTLAGNPYISIYKNNGVLEYVSLSLGRGTSCAKSTGTSLMVAGGKRSAKDQSVVDGFNTSFVRVDVSPLDAPGTPLGVEFENVVSFVVDGVGNNYSSDFVKLTSSAVGQGEIGVNHCRMGEVNIGYTPTGISACDSSLVWSNPNLTHLAFGAPRASAVIGNNALFFCDVSDTVQTDCIAAVYQIL